MIASYLLPRRISLSTNFTQSSTNHLIGASARPDDAAFSFAQVWRILYQFAEPVPVCRLLREETGVLETEWLQVECELFVIYGPLLWQTEEFPFPAALIASVIVTVEFIP